MDNYYSFVFRGLLTEEALDKAGRKSKIINNSSLDQEILTRLPFDLLDKEFLCRANKMATVYALVAAFENTVREFISRKLLEEFEEDWWKNGVSEKIRKKADSRKEKEDKIKWHTQRGDMQINYCDFGDLNSIIGKNWELFEPHLEALEWVNSIFKPLEISRNVLMHGGNLEKQDIERIGLLIRDWIRQVGT